MPINPVVTDPNLTIQFPGVTQSEMKELLLEAEQQGAKVVSDSDFSIDVVTIHKFLWSVEFTCFWNQATGLTIQIPKDEYRGIVQSQVSTALAKIRGQQ
jgi:hypothetical protein